MHNMACRAFCCNTVHGFHAGSTILELSCRIEEDITDQDATPVRQMESDKSGRVSRVQFTDLNKTLLTASEDGCLRRWDVEVCPLAPTQC